MLAYSIVLSSLQPEPDSNQIPTTRTRHRRTPTSQSKFEALIQNIVDQQTSESLKSALFQLEEMGDDLKIELNVLQEEIMARLNDLINPVLDEFKDDLNIGFEEIKARYQVLHLKTLDTFDIIGNQKLCRRRCPRVPERGRRAKSLSL